MVRPNLIICQRRFAILHRSPLRLAIALVVLVLALLAVASTSALAQSPAAPTTTEAALGASSLGATTLPSLWYLFAAGLAMLVPAGFVLVGSANLEQSHAWNAALGGLAAAGLALFAYWAIGFALQFGGVGLVYDHPALRGQVWEWSPLSTEWGIGWGMAGLTGWFLSGDLSALSYTLFMGHAPWVMVAALLPVMTLRGRAPAIVTLLLAFAMGGIVYPLAGNWVQGGGWLNALGRNMNLGHGFVDFGGAGVVHLVAASFALAALAVWSTRRSDRGEPVLPPAHQPLLAVVGALLILGGGIAWLFANPLQVESVGELGMMRGAVNSLLAAAGGIVVPLLYTWFVTGSSEPTMSARGFVAGVVAGLACAPFVAPGFAFLIGLLAGATVPFVTYLLDGKLRIDDRSGVVISSGVPAIVGLLLVGVFADGRAGAGWQVTGVGSYLGVSGQGVSGLFVAPGFQMDFPGQLQSQVIGVVALALWGFLAGLILCVPLGLLFHSLLHRNDRPGRGITPASPAMASAATMPVVAPQPSQPTDALTYRRTDAPALPTTGASQAKNPFLTQNMPAGPPPSAVPPAQPITGESALPGYAPGERRLPPATNYVAPTAASNASVATPSIAIPAAPPTPSTSYVAAEANAPLQKTVDTTVDTTNDSASLESIGAETAQTELPSAEQAKTDPAHNTTPAVAPDYSANPVLSPWDSLATSAPREGYWPGQPASTASSSPANPSPGQASATPIDLFAPAPGTPSNGPTATNQTSGTPVTGSTQPMPITDPLGFDSPSDPYDALEAHSEPPPARPNTTRNGGNPLAPLGRRRTTSLPDDTSPASV